MIRVACAPGGRGTRFLFVMIAGLSAAPAMAQSDCHVGLEDKAFPTSGTFVTGDHDVSVNPEAHLVRLGLNFHF